MNHKKELEKKVIATEIKWLRRILRIGYKEHITNELHHTYADDCQVYLATDPKDIQASKDRIVDCIDAIRNCMLQNRLVLNPGKTKFIW